MVAILATAALAFVLVRSFASGSGTTPEQLRAAVVTQLTTSLEQATPADHANHGHGDVYGSTKVLCAVEVLGFEPADAKDARDLRKVYANHQCAVSDNGRPFDYAVKTSGPLVATWGQPPVVTVVLQQGADYPDRVRAAIPAEYQEKALAATINPDALADLRTRFDRSVAEFWAAFKASNPPR
ncbi:hypothetical protein GCM10009681_56490 [Luedemannella helvata]|uniref:Uncharacterized protein n=1 Tax=Luedemannella helvata TaxID=349315 RepID=A0ABP4XJM1_9ACTN